jgi:adenylate cyclase
MSFMSFAFAAYLQRQQPAIAFAVLASGVVLFLRSTGVMQSAELKGLDQLLAMHPAEPQDRRVVVVGVGEADLNWLRSPSLSDSTLASAITQIKRQQPRVIGLDFYRSLPVGSGTDQLRVLFRSTPNLIGIEKVLADPSDPSQTTIPGNDSLVERDQVAASDVIVDPDGRVRRGLLFPDTTGPRVLEGLGLRLALDYLAEEGYRPDPTQSTLTIRGVAFPPVLSSTGGYARINDGGYQLLLNPRAAAMAVVSLKDVLTGKVAPDLMRDRVVLIGSTALSSADVFYSNHSNAKGRQTGITFGVELHAELASQLIAQVLDRRPGLWALADELEMVLVVVIVTAGLLVQQSMIASECQRILGGLVATVGGTIVCYGSLVVWGLWLPLLPVMLSFWLAALGVAAYRMVELRELAERDGLTQLANRRTFDGALQEAWLKGLRSQQPVSIILCDVDHFKLYNDVYGHQQGDDCLRYVAKALRSTVKGKRDLVARYGGEEFVILLPNTTAEAALALAETVRQAVKVAQLPHKASKVSDHVTLSLGVTSLLPSMDVPISSVIQFADLGLYRAKEAGRDRSNLHLPGQVQSEEP